jgi:hypothetical protein
MLVVQVSSQLQQGWRSCVNLQAFRKYEGSNARITIRIHLAGQGSPNTYSAGALLKGAGRFIDD